MSVSRRFICIPIGILVLLLLLQPSRGITDAEVDLIAAIDSLYGDMGLDAVIDKEPFRLAVIGFANLCDRNQLKKRTPLSIIDFTKPSTEKRLVIVDIPGRRLLRTSLVAHGKNSGENYAKRFSDEPGSLMSSFGFFATGETYYGTHDYTLRLHGLEKEFNGNAVERFIVIHGAWYVSQKFIDEHGRLGRSWGCPALPLETAAEIIDLIKDGSCLFIYADDPGYLEDSSLLDKKRAAGWFAEYEGLWDDCDPQQHEMKKGG